LRLSACPLAPGIPHPLLPAPLFLTLGGAFEFLPSAVAIVLLIGLANGPPASARPLATIAADGTLRVGMTGDYAPFAVREADGQISGADVTMAGSLAKALGVALVIVPTT
jgi:ABC-type amino acid transport substrate-binding protein